MTHQERVEQTRKERKERFFEKHPEACLVQGGPIAPDADMTLEEKREYNRVAAAKWRAKNREKHLSYMRGYMKARRVVAVKPERVPCPTCGRLMPVKKPSF